MAPTISDSVGLAQGPRIWISNKFSHDVDAANLQLHFDNTTNNTLVFTEVLPGNFLVFVGF